MGFLFPSQEKGSEFMRKSWMDFGGLFFLCAENNMLWFCEKVQYRLEKKVTFGVDFIFFRK